MKELFRLPDRTYCEDVHQYCDSWRELADKVIKCLPDLKLNLIAFDPNLLFSRSDWQYNNSLTLDVDLCRSIIKLSNNNGKETR